MPEARLEDSGSGLTPVTDGWFVVNATAEWFRRERPPSWARLPWA